MTANDPVALHAAAADDIEALAKYLPAGRLHYQNIGAAQAHERALERWPLLAELQHNNHEESASIYPALQRVSSAAAS